MINADMLASSFLSKCATLEYSSTIDTAGLFQNGFISRKNPTIQKLVYDFIQRESGLCIFDENSTEAARACWEFIKREDLLPENIKSIKQEYKSQKEDFDSQRKKVKQAFDQNLKDLNATLERCSANWQKGMNLRRKRLSESAQKVVDITIRVKKESDLYHRDEKSLQGEIDKVRGEKDKTCSSIRALNQTLLSSNRNQAKITSSISEYEQSLNELKNVESMLELEINNLSEDFQRQLCVLEDEAVKKNRLKIQAAKIVMNYATRGKNLAYIYQKSRTDLETDRNKNLARTDDTRLKEKAVQDLQLLVYGLQFEESFE